MNLLFVLHTPRRAVRHRNDKGQRTKDKPQAKQSLLRPSRPLESLVKQGVGVERRGRSDRYFVPCLCVCMWGFGGGWMLAFCSRPKPLVMKNLTPYLYLTLGREGIVRTGIELFVEKGVFPCL